MVFKPLLSCPFIPTETLPQAFGIALSQVIANDRVHKQRHDPLRGEHSDPSELMLSFLHLTSNFKRANKDISSSNSSLSSTCETPNESPLRCTPDPAPRTRRRVGNSVNKTQHSVRKQRGICLITFAHVISLALNDLFGYSLTVGTWCGH